MFGEIAVHVPRRPSECAQLRDDALVLRDENASKL
jgi:hypothetical protein